MNNGDIGKKIVHLREVKRFSQKDLANLIPISQSTLSRWEKGSAIPSIQHLKRICEILDVPIEKIVTDENKENNQKSQKPLLAITFFMAVIIALSFLYLAIPKYKVIKETEHCSDYGNTLTIYVMPLFFISESGADSYGRHLAKKHSAGKKLDAVEVIFVRKTTNLYEETNEYFTNIYYVPSLSN